MDESSTDLRYIEKRHKIPKISEMAKVVESVVETQAIFLKPGHKYRDELKNIRIGTHLIFVIPHFDQVLKEGVNTHALGDNTLCDNTLQAFPNVWVGTMLVYLVRRLGPWRTESN